MALPKYLGVQIFGDNNNVSEKLRPGLDAPVGSCMRSSQPAGKPIIIPADELAWPILEPTLDLMADQPRLCRKKYSCVKS